jgi:hypothetical protein
MPTHDVIGWHCSTVLEKYRVRESGMYVPNSPRFDLDEYDCALDHYDTVFSEGNLLVIGGASALWDRLIDATPTTGVLDQSNTVIGVGTSATQATNDQTALQATNDSSNRHYIAMAATYPLHTDSTSDSSATSCQFQSSFGTTAANFAWREWGVGRGTAGAGGTGSHSRMLNRKVQSFGTKTNVDTWVLTVTITLA